jgi:pyruvate, water dikinase
MHPLPIAAQRIRELVIHASLRQPLDEAIKGAYRTLCERSPQQDLDVAVRSSATPKTCPMQALRVSRSRFSIFSGLDAVRRCIAWLFTDRAIVYRENHGSD